MIALLFLRSGWGRKYLETYRRRDSLGKRRFEKVAEISVKEEVVFSGFHRALLSSLPWSTFSSTTFRNLREHLKGSACEMCEYEAAPRDD